MLMAAMRLNVPTIFVSGGPMEAGLMGDRKLDLVDAMVMGADESVSDSDLKKAEQSACPTCGSCSGMFTANSMNCLTEALGMSLPGNGTIVATHVNRLKLFEKAAGRIVEMAQEYYFKGNDTVLPRQIASKKAFLNAMTLDIAMGGSTNTVLHLLAVAHEAGVDFTMKDIDALSRITPCLCKVSPSSQYHVEDVNRAGGIMSLMGELNRAKLLDTSAYRVDGLNLEQAITEFDIVNEKVSAEAIEIFSSAPGRKINLVMGSQNTLYSKLDDDRVSGCIRSMENAYHKDGGLAVLYGNIATTGSIVKTAGVDPSLLHFEGVARVFESQDEAVSGILGGKVNPGDVVVIRYEGPKGGPGMQEMLYPTSYLKTLKLDKDCALITDGRFSGGTSGLSIGHVSPEAASGGEIALIKDNDKIVIDIATRSVSLIISDEELELRKKNETLRGKDAYKTQSRKRNISTALKIYALHVSSADTGAIRII